MDVAPLCFCSDWEINWPAVSAIGTWFAAAGTIAATGFAVVQSARTRRELNGLRARSHLVLSIALGSRVKGAYRLAWEAERLLADNLLTGPASEHAITRSRAMLERLELEISDADLQQNLVLPEQVVRSILNARDLVPVVRRRTKEGPGLLQTAKSNQQQMCRQFRQALLPALEYFDPNDMEWLRGDPDKWEEEFAERMRAMKNPFLPDHQ